MYRIFYAIVCCSVGDRAGSTARRRWARVHLLHDTDAGWPADCGGGVCVHHARLQTECKGRACPHIIQAHVHHQSRKTGHLQDRGALDEQRVRSVSWRSLNIYHMMMNVLLLVYNSVIKCAVIFQMCLNRTCLKIILGVCVFVRLFVRSTVRVPVVGILLVENIFCKRLLI